MASCHFAAMRMLGFHGMPDNAGQQGRTRHPYNWRKRQGRLMKRRQFATTAALSCVSFALPYRAWSQTLSDEQLAARLMLPFSEPLW
jgi:hypothetical protein